MREITIVATLLAIACATPVTASTARSLYADCSAVTIPDIKRSSDDFERSSRCINFLWAVAKRMKKTPALKTSKRSSVQQKELSEYIKKHGLIPICPPRSREVERALAIAFLRYWDAKGLGVFGQWITSDAAVAEEAFLSMGDCVE